MTVCGDKAGFVMEDYEDYGPKNGPQSKPKVVMGKCKKGGKKR